MNLYLKLTAFIFFLLLTCLTLSPSQNSRPNVILMMADDLGYETIAVNGGESYSTPTLDRLAAEGARFTQAFAQPLCTPSRVKIMTGIYNIRNYTKFGVLPRDQVTFGNQMKAAGYVTAVTGKWQLGTQLDSPTHFGFDKSFLWQHTNPNQYKSDPVNAGNKIDSRYPNPEMQRGGVHEFYSNGEYGPQLCANFVMDFIEQNKDTSFFVYYPMILTHWPFDPTPISAIWDPTRAGSTTNKGDLGDQQQNFADMVYYMDSIIGQIDAKLASLGIRDNTLLIFTGDNGTDAPIVSQWNGIQVDWGKRQMNDNGTKVPLIVSWPGVINQGFVTDELVDHTDYFPTILEAGAAALPDTYTNDGRSFISTLKGEPGRQKDWVYVWYAGRVIARNKDYQILFTINSGEMVFSNNSDMYEPQVLDTTNLTNQEQLIFNELKDVITLMDTSSANGTPLPVKSIHNLFRRVTIKTMSLIFDGGVKIKSREFYKGTEQIRFYDIHGRLLD